MTVRKINVVTAIGMALAVAATGITATASSAQAAEKDAGTMVVAQAGGYQLFKVVSAKDDIIIGLSPDEVKTIGASDPLSNLAHKLANSGQITYWQFATKKASNGDLELTATQRVAIMKSDAVRIEPYKTTLKVVGPSK